MQPAPPNQAALREFADGLSRTVRGRVVRVRVLPPQGASGSVDVDGYQEPELVSSTSGLSVDVAVEAVEEVNSGRLEHGAYLRGGEGDRDCGPALRDALCCGVVTGSRFRCVCGFRSGIAIRGRGSMGITCWNRASAFKQRCIRRSWLRGLRWMCRRGADRRDVQCRLFAAQAWAAGKLAGYVPSSANRGLPKTMQLTAGDAGMLNAMLFGDRLGLNHELRRGFERTGSFHLFVVSGMHVGLIAFGIFWMARRARLPVWAATFATIGLTAAYAALTGFGVPVQRALGMASIFLVARLLDRQRSTLNALGAAVLGVLAWSPSSLFEASFQMTFLAIVGVAGIAIPLGERTILPYARATRGIGEVRRDIRFEPRLAQFRVMLRMFGEALRLLAGRWAFSVPALAVRWVLWVVELCLIALVTEIVMALPMALYFHRAALFALPANLFSIPIVAVLVPVAIATFVGTLIHPWVAAMPGALTAFLLHAITGAIGHVSRLPAADLRLPGPMLWVSLTVAASLAFCCWAVRLRRGIWPVMAAAMLPVVLALVLWPEPTETVAGALEVTAIDVGQGDSLLVVGPEGRAMLVDAGGPLGGPFGNAAGSHFDLGEEVVSPYLWSRRIRGLDVVALTHEHSDHMGGMPAILRSFRPRELWVGVDVPSPAYAALLEEAASLGIVVRRFRAGDGFAWDGVRVAVLAPEVGYRSQAAPSNNDSLVMRFEYGKASVLMEGDAEKPEEAGMLAHGRMEPVTLLKVGHHGSATSSTEAFVAAAAPRDAIVSVGRNNTFGHPRREVIERFAKRGTKLYRTDMFGVTTFLLDREGGIREINGASK